MNKNKIQWVENLRVLSCLAVIMIHVIDGWFNVVSNPDISIFRWVLDNVFFQLLIRYAVPVFIMISGYLLLNPDKKVNVEKIKNYIFKIIICIMIFGYGFALIENILNYGLNNIPSLLINSFLNVLQEESWAHLWYLYMLVGIYILLPILKKFVNYCDSIEIKFVLSILFITSFIVPSINSIFDLNITSFYVGAPIFSFVFYFLIGYYVGNNKFLSDKIIYWLGIIGYVGFILLCFAKSKYDIDISNNNIFICLYSVLILKLFSSGKVKVHSNKLINNISKYSLGIYIVHTFWLNVLNKGLNIYPDVFPPFLGEMSFLIYAIILSYISVFILSKIPLIKKIII